MMTDVELREIYDHDENMFTFEEALLSPHQRRWWVCKNKHSYARSVKRQRESELCPFCSNLVVLTGFNDLKTKRPDLVVDWDYDKNDGVKPDDVLYTGHSFVDWKCHVCGNEWRTRLSARSRDADSGCPECNNCNGNNVPPSRSGSRCGSINTDAILAAEFDVDKNDMPMHFYTLGQDRKIWWKCGAGHSYNASIAVRSSKNRRGCVQCKKEDCVNGVNDLVTLNSWVLKEWDYDNNSINPNTVGLGYRRYVNWVCYTCGTRWSATVSQRVRGVNLCPKCKKISKEVVANAR